MTIAVERIAVAARGFIELFGPLRVSLRDTDISPKGRKARAIIGVLALSDRATCTRERLAGLLWGDRGEEQSRASLRQAVLELRSGLIGASGLVLVDRDLIRLDLDRVTLETSAIARAAAAGDLQSLRDLLPSCAQPLMHGLEGVSPAFDEWLAVERTRQRDAVLEVAIRCAEAELEASRLEHLTGLLNELERLDPGNEIVARIAMRSAHRAGDRAGLHRRYRRLRDVLDAEFGAEPSDETRRLFEALQRGSPAAPAMSSGLDMSRPEEIAQHPAPVEVNDLPLLQVCSFRDIGAGDSGNLALAIRSEILAGLARYRDLRLAADSEAPQPVGYKLMADVRRAKGALVITPQLLRHTGEVVWADRFDVPGEDIEPGLDLMVSRIVATAAPALMTDLVARLGPRPSGTLYGRYLLARESSHRPTSFEQASAAAAELEAIIQQDSGFGSAMLALARIYDTDFVWTRANSSGRAERMRAAALSKRALALDHDNVSAWTHVGWAHLWDGNWTAAHRAFLSALTLNPFNVARILEVAYGRIFLGDLTGSAELMEKCVGIEPRPGDALLGDRGLLYLISGDYDAATADFDLIASPDLSMKLHAAAACALSGQTCPEVTERAADAIASIFPDGRMPSEEELSIWVNSTHPFANDDHRGTLLSGVRQAFRGRQAHI